MEGENLKEDDFTLVVLTKVNPEKPLPTPIFLKVDGKFIKFKGAGEPIGAEKFDFFIAKGVKNIYIHNEDIMDFLDWLNESEETEESSFVDQFGEENRGFFKRSKEFKEKVYDVYFEEELNPEIVFQLQDHVADFVSDIKEKPVAAQAVALMMSRNKTVADHSINVANLAVFLGMVLGHGHQFVLENLYMGAIFHDYGKLKIDPKLLENNDGRLYSQAIQNHPIFGVKMLRKTQGIPKQVLTIIAQHHEQFNGHGYPLGVGGDELYELAQIVSMANIFDNTLKENSKYSEDERYKRAIKVIQYDNGKNWNPKYIERVLEALNYAFMDEKKSA